MCVVDSNGVQAVSYTHLDVYKRQFQGCLKTQFRVLLSVLARRKICSRPRLSGRKHFGMGILIFDTTPPIQSGPPPKTKFWLRS